MKDAESNTIFMLIFFGLIFVVMVGEIFGWMI